MLFWGLWLCVHWVNKRDTLLVVGHKVKPLLRPVGFPRKCRPAQWKQGLMLSLSRVGLVVGKESPCQNRGVVPTPVSPCRVGSGMLMAGGQRGPFSQGLWDFLKGNHNVWDRSLAPLWEKSSLRDAQKVLPLVCFSHPRLPGIPELGCTASPSSLPLHHRALILLLQFKHTVCAWIQPVAPYQHNGINSYIA